MSTAYIPFYLLLLLTSTIQVRYFTDNYNANLTFLSQTSVTILQTDTPDDVALSFT